MIRGLWCIDKHSIREDKWLPLGLIGVPAKQEDPETVAELIDQGARVWKEQELKDLLEYPYRERLVQTRGQTE